MANESVVLRKVPKAAAAAIAACIFGFIYSFSFGSLLEAQHWYSFYAPSELAPEEFVSAVSFISISLFVYYTMFLVAAALLILRSRRYMIMTLLIMAGARLVSLLLMFRPGFSMVFQFGFETLLEIVAYLCIAYIYKNVGRNKKLYDSRITVCVLGVLAETVPLLRNFQYLFLDGLSITAKISALMVPCSVAVFIILVALRSACFRRMTVLNDPSEENGGDDGSGQSGDDIAGEDEESGDDSEDDEFDADNTEAEDDPDGQTVEAPEAAEDVSDDEEKPAEEQKPKKVTVVKVTKTDKT